MTTYDAQLILAVKDGKLFCEAPSLNGTRNAIDLNEWTVDDLPPPIADALFALAIQTKDREAAIAKRQSAEETARKKRFFSLSYEARELQLTEAEANARAKSGVKPVRAKHPASATIDADLAAELFN